MSTKDWFESAKTAKEKEKLLSTGCRKFDEYLQGGVPCRGITQIYGAASTGKTQLALQLCLTVQLPLSEGGLGGGAIYICTQAAFPSRRLQQLLENSELSKKHEINSDSIYVEHCATMEELETCLLRRVPILMSARKINLIIVDSVAAPYRSEEWEDPSNTRAKSLRTVGQQLHALCKNNDVCIVCINQVKAVIGTTILHDNSDEMPALGTTWTSMVTTSLQFYRIGIQRYICVKLSSKLPAITIPFEIHEFGVRAIE